MSGNNGHTAGAKMACLGQQLALHHAAWQAADMFQAFCLVHISIAALEEEEEKNFFEDL